MQEWAPLLPILHRPSFLRTYEDYLADPDAEHWHSHQQVVAQLFLIFEIAALSSVVSMLEAPLLFPLLTSVVVPHQAGYSNIRASMAESAAI